MNQETIVALVGAITNWDLIAQGLVVQTDEDCLLCELLFSDEYDDCPDCPVFKRTKELSCVNTPWEDVCIPYSSLLTAPHCAGVAEEIEFLISLLPVGSKEAKAYEL